MALEESILDLTEKVAILSIKVEDMAKEIDEIHIQTSEIRDYANKWRGGFYALTGLGALIGTLAAFWDRVKVMVWGH